MEFRELRDKVFARLNGIQLDNLGNTAIVNAILACKQQMKDAPAHPSVTSAVDYDQTEDALQLLYVTSSLQLKAAAPSVYAAFKGLDA